MSRVRVVVTGDSTASDYPADRAPRTGWGQALAARDDLEVINHALSGASTGSFIAAGLLDRALDDLREGDLLLTCFGHNDGKNDHRFTDPDVAFPRNLRRFVAGARARGATPVLLTPIERRRFRDGRLYSTHGVYPARTRAVARSERVALIDLSVQTGRLWQEQGVEGSKRSFLLLEPGEWPGYPDGENDNTHLSAYGAGLVADLVYQGLVDAGLVGAGSAGAGSVGAGRAPVAAGR